MVFLREGPEKPFRVVLRRATEPENAVKMPDELGRSSPTSSTQDGGDRNPLVTLIRAAGLSSSWRSGPATEMSGDVTARVLATALLSPESSMCVTESVPDGGARVLAHITDLNGWATPSRARRTWTDRDGRSVLCIAGPAYDLGRPSPAGESCALVLDLGEPPAGQDIDGLLRSLVTSNERRTDEDQETIWMGIAFLRGSTDYVAYLRQETERAYVKMLASAARSDECEWIRIVTSPGSEASTAAGGKLNFLVRAGDDGQETIGVPVALLCSCSDAWSSYVMNGSPSTGDLPVMDLTADGVTADQLRTLLELMLLGAPGEDLVTRWRGMDLSEDRRAVGALAAFAEEFHVSGFGELIELYVLQNAGPGTWAELADTFGRTGGRFLDPVAPWIILDRWDVRRQRCAPLAPPATKTVEPSGGVGPSRPVAVAPPDRLELARRRLEILERIAWNNGTRIWTSTTHPVDREAADRWRKAHGTEGLRDFATAIIQSLRHVGFLEFTHGLSRACAWSRDYAWMMKKPPHVLLLLPGGGSTRKSNFWVSLLLLQEEIAQIQFHGVITNAYEAYEVCRQNPNDNVMMAVPDDAVYSGIQMLSNLTPHLVALGELSRWNKKRDPKLDYSEGERQINQIDRSGRLLKVVLAPYVGIPGRELLRTNFGDLLFPNTTNFLEAAGQIPTIVNALKGNAELRHFVVHNMGYRDNVCVVYFDHKLPDQLSTMTRVLAYGDVFDAKGAVAGHVNFIKNCDVPARHRNDPSWMQYDEKDLCPRGIYKTVRFVSEEEGVEIEEGTIAELFRKRGIESPLGARPTSETR